MIASPWSSVHQGSPDPAPALPQELHATELVRLPLSHLLEPKGLLT